MSIAANLELLVNGNNNKLDKCKYNGIVSNSKNITAFNTVIFKSEHLADSSYNSVARSKLLLTIV